MTDKRVAFCHKCKSQFRAPSGDGTYRMIGCADNDKIKSYTDALKLCPLLADIDSNLECVEGQTGINNGRRG